MKELNKKDIRRLKTLAHDLRPAVMIGQKGPVDTVVQALSVSLSAHELVKIKFIDHKDEKGEISGRLAEMTDSSLVAIIGNTAIFYRENPDLQKRKVFL